MNRAPMVPAEPFRTWLVNHEAQIAKRSENPTSEIAARLLPHLSAPAARRQICAWKDGLHRTTNGEVAIGTFSMIGVEEALFNAGYRLADLYPDLEQDVKLEPETWCRTCDDVTTPIHGICPWCDNHPAELGVRRRQPGCHPHLTDDEIRAAHPEYQAGVSALALGRRVWERAGYSSAKSAANAFTNGFKRLGLDRQPVAA